MHGNIAVTPKCATDKLLFYGELMAWKPKSYIARNCVAVCSNLPVGSSFQIQWETYSINSCTFPQVWTGSPHQFFDFSEKSDPNTQDIRGLGARRKIGDMGDQT